MGYRSKVSLVMKEKDYDELRKRAKNSPDKALGARVISFLDSGRKNAPVCSEKEYVYLYWEWVKWYYEDVDFIEGFLEEDTDGKYDCIIISEQYEDIECHFGTDKCLLKLKREAEFVQ